MGETKRATEDLSSSQWCVGVPYQGSRPLTDDEVGLIKTQIKRYQQPLILSVSTLLPLIVLFLCFARSWFGVLCFLTTLGLSINSLRAGYPFFLLRKSLANGQVDIFSGRIRTAPLDIDQERFLKANILLNGIKVNLEIVSGTKLLLSVNGLRVICKQTSLAPIYYLKHPTEVIDIPTRLTDSEKIELQDRVRRYRQQLIWGNSFLVQYFMALSMVYFMLNRRASDYFLGWACVSIVAVGIPLVLVLRKPAWTLVGLMKKDIEQGDLIWEEATHSSILASSRVLWTIDGLPAAWRLSRTYIWKPPEPVQFFAASTVKTEA